MTGTIGRRLWHAVKQTIDEKRVTQWLNLLEHFELRIQKRKVPKSLSDVGFDLKGKASQLLDPVWDHVPRLAADEALKRLCSGEWVAEGFRPGQLIAERPPPS
jgi:hypothetical protein